jgi:kumamolisin
MPALVPISGSKRPFRSGSLLIGDANPNEEIEVTVRVRSRGKPVLSAENMGALPPLRRQYLSREQFAATHGAAPEDLAAVEQFADGHGLNVVSTSAAQRNVVLSGSIKSLSAALHVKLVECAHEEGNYRGHPGPVRLPRPLAQIVQGVFGLDNRRQARPHVVRAPPAAVGDPAGPSGYTAAQVAQLYDFPAAQNGRGQCIGLLEFGGGFDAGDLSAYFASLRMAAPSVGSVSVDGVNNTPGSNPVFDSEVTLDAQIVGAIAPGAKIVFYFAPFTERGWVDALTTAIHDAANTPSVLSISWGYSEGEPMQGFEWSQQAVRAVNETLQAAAAMGVSVCVSCGDKGSNNGIPDGHAHVNFPASSPYVLACGGTKLTAANNKILDEVVWNQAGSGTGGGISDMNPLPVWQKGIVPPSINPDRRVGRAVPDVAGNAAPATGYKIFQGGKIHVLGGTSAVAPLWAGLLARINQKLGTPVGYFNPLFYGKQTYRAAFKDITIGNNDTTGQVGGYSADKGWDACTGWGSPRGSTLLAALGIYYT